MPIRLRKLRNIGRRGAVLAVAATGAIGATAAVITSASAAPTAAPGPAVHRGAGIVIARGTDFVGQYRVKAGGKTIEVYCINPTKREPGHVRLSTVTRVTALSTTTSRELAEVLTAHGQTSNRVVAEATSQALNYLAGNRAVVARRSRYIARSTQQLAMAYVAEAKRLRGAYTVTIHLSTAALPGQRGTGTVTVAAAGGALTTTVRLSHAANVSTPATVKTDSRGRGTFSYQTVSGGAVHITATARGLAPTTLRMSHPAGGYQRMVSASASTSARATASYQGRVSGFSDSYACTSECNGHPPVTLRACAPASAYPSHITYAWAGGTKIVNFPASRRSACAAVTVVLTDGARVTATWQYRNRQGWTAKVAASGAFVVDCPATPPVAVVMSYTCTSASITAELGRQAKGVLVAERNTTGHPMVLVVSGAISGRYPLSPGATAEARSWPIACGTHSVITVKGGIQRSNGAWNYGPTATITTP